MRLPLSIIIPALNEQDYLPKLLSSINNQTYQPKELIVADAFSTDDTRKIAKFYGCKVVHGGSIATGRNNGAKAASQDLLLFLDADMILPDNFLELAFVEVKARKIEVAACFGSVISTSKIDDILIDGMTFLMKITEKVLPHAGAPCIFIKKSLHYKIRGFKEMFMNEDQDYVRRAAKKGKFSYLRNTKLFVSNRRLIREGRLKLMAKYTLAEMHLIFLGPIRKPLYNYEFGNFKEIEED